MAVKNPTQWQPPTGKGFVITAGTKFLVTNSGSFLVTNAGDNLVTTPTYDVPKYPTTWSQTGV